MKILIQWHLFTNSLYGHLDKVYITKEVEAVLQNGMLSIHQIQRSLMLRGISWDGLLPFVFYDSNLSSLGYEIIVDNYLGRFIRNFNDVNSRI